MIFKSRVLVVSTTNPQYTLASPITPIIPIIRLYPLITPTFPLLPPNYPLLLPGTLQPIPPFLTHSPSAKSLPVL